MLIAVQCGDSLNVIVKGELRWRKRTQALW